MPSNTKQSPSAQLSHVLQAKTNAKQEWFPANQPYRIPGFLVPVARGFRENGHNSSRPRDDPASVTSLTVIHGCGSLFRSSYYCRLGRATQTGLGVVASRYIFSTGHMDSQFHILFASSSLLHASCITSWSCVVRCRCLVASCAQETAKSQVAVPPRTERVPGDWECV